MSPDQGTTGVTVKSITWLTDLTVSSNPIPSPGAGYQLIESDYDDRDGYRVWTAKFAKGYWRHFVDVDTRDGGKLIVYSKTSINAVPPTPSATIGGTVTLISAKVRSGTDAANGTIIYDYTWAGDWAKCRARCATRSRATKAPLASRSSRSGTWPRSYRLQSDQHAVRDTAHQCRDRSFRTATVSGQPPTPRARAKSAGTSPTRRAADRLRSGKPDRLPLASSSARSAT